MDIKGRCPIKLSCRPQCQAPGNVFETVAETTGWGGGGAAEAGGNDWSECAVGWGGARSTVAQGKGCEEAFGGQRSTWKRIRLISLGTHTRPDDDAWCDQ